jgi:hypothetical protein
LGIILHKSGDLLDDAVLKLLRVVKVAYFSETVHRVMATIQPGRNNHFPFLRVNWSDSTGEENEGFAQLRCMFKAESSTSDSLLVFLVRYAC